MHIIGHDGLQITTTVSDHCTPIKVLCEQQGQQCAIVWQEWLSWTLGGMTHGTATVENKLEVS